MLQLFLGIGVATLVMTYALCKVASKERHFREEKAEIKIGCIKQSLGEVEKE